MIQVPFGDLNAQYLSIKDNIDLAIASVIADTAFIGGKYVKQFEKDFAEAYDVKHCVSVANGTDAIYIVLRMLGIGQGDEVITTGHSWISTAETIAQTGATPVFIDTDEYFTINTDLIEAKITPRTKAIIPVHLYGQMAEMDHLVAICKEYNLYLVEDCAQSHFSEYKGKRAGTFGIAGTFSFFPGKNLGAYGDAGCILTNDDAIAEKCKMFANHGALVKHTHLIEGINSRLDGLQAAILSAKLPYIHQWTAQRIAKANHYDQLLADIPGITLPLRRPETKHTFHLYVVKTTNREALMQKLDNAGIAHAIHYPVPLPFTPAFQHLGYKLEDFPKIAAYAGNILSLPIYPELTLEQIELVNNAVRGVIYA